MPGFEWFGAEERKHVNDVLETGVLMRYGFDGPRKGIFKANELEKAITETFGCQYAQLTSSGTAALTTAMAALGIGAGHEVIMPSFTFVASFEAILSVGATPVLADVDDTLTLSPTAVEAAITPRTKAIMPVHMCGSMADMDALMDIAKRHNLIVLEDACQAIGGTYNGQRLGTIGDAGTFSFDYVKTITCGEGGVVMTNNEAVYRACDGYTDHGHDHLGADRGADQHPFLGLNYRISELHAAVGLAQIGKLADILRVQRANKKILKDALATVEGITFRRLPDPDGDNAAFLSFFMPSAELAEAAITAIKAAGLPAFYWYANNWHYVRQWHHLTNATSLNPMLPGVQQAITAISEQDFSASDAVMSRCISVLINLSWDEETVKQKANALVSVISEQLSVNNEQLAIA
jgi:8-amino-3,8-dideoxy-alpha-D-manno-octulosonate transaminase